MRPHSFLVFCSFLACTGGRGSGSDTDPSTGSATTGGTDTTDDPTTGTASTVDPSSTGTTGSSTSADTTSGPTTGDTSTGDVTATIDASTTSDTTGDASSSSTTAPDPVCGDGTVDENEACDDGNAFAGDGCTINCEKECSALRFEGASAAFAADPGTLNFTSVTLGAWYRAKVGVPEGIIAAKQGSVFGGHYTYSLSVGAASGVTARLQTGLNAEFLDLGFADAKPDDKWHHIAVTYTAATGEGELYVDGQSVDFGQQGNGLVAAIKDLPFTLGAVKVDGVLQLTSKAAVANVVVYDKQLSDAEVAELAQGVYAPGAKAFFPTLEGMGNESADASGNGHTLDVTGVAWEADGPFCAP